MHISLLSKTELFISSVIENLVFPSYINFSKETFIYSLIKFLFTYRDITFIQKFFSTDSSFYSREILEQLRTFLKTVISNIEGVKRKQVELSNLCQLLYILEQSTIIDVQYAQYSWDYSTIFSGFNLLVEERGIDQKQVNLIIDNEENTYRAARDSGRYSSQEGDSKIFVGIRFLDILSNFIGRMIVALDKDLRETPILNKETLQDFDYVSKKILNPKWFSLSENQYTIYI